MAGMPWEDYAGAAPAAPSAGTMPWEDYASKPLTVHGTREADPAQGELPGDTMLGDNFDVSKANALTARTVMEGATKGVLGLPGLGVDAALNAGYYGKKLLSKTGLVDAPDPANYALDQGSFPGSHAVAKIAEAGPDALGIRKPVTGRDRVLTAIGEGAVGAGAGVGVGSALGLLGGSAARAGAFLADQPAAQVAGGALAGGAGQGAQEAGGTQGASLAASVAAGALPLMLTRGAGVGAAARATDTTTLRGVDNAAARIVQRTAENPATAADRISAAPEIVPGAQPNTLALAGDPGLNVLAPHMKDLDPAQHASMVANSNDARVRLLEHAGFNNPQAEDAAYSSANAVAAAQKPAVLNSAPPMAAAPIVEHFSRIANDPNQTTAVQEMAQGARQEILRRLEPAVQTGVNSRGQPVYAPREITPRSLEAAKTSFGSAFTGKPSNPNTPAYAMHTRAEVFQPGGAMDAFNAHIESGAPGYQAYVDQQAQMRTNADELNFGNTLIDKSADAFDNGVPSLSPTKFGNNTRRGKLDDTLASGNRMTMERLRQSPRPERAEAIDRVRADMERDALVRSRGTGTTGSNTIPKASFLNTLDTEATAGLPLRTRAAGALGNIARVAGPAVAALSGPLGVGGFKVAAGALGLSQAAGIVSRNAETTAGRAAGRIGGVLGRAYADPDLMERLLRQNVAERPGAGAYAAVPGAALSPRTGAVAGALAPRADPPRKKKKGR